MGIIAEGDRPKSPGKGQWQILLHWCKKEESGIFVEGRIRTIGKTPVVPNLSWDRVVSLDGLECE